GRETRTAHRRGRAATAVHEAAVGGAQEAERAARGPTAGHRSAAGRRSAAVRRTATASCRATTARRRRWAVLAGGPCREPEPVGVWRGLLHAPSACELALAVRPRAGGIRDRLPFRRPHRVQLRVRGGARGGLRG